MQRRVTTYITAIHLLLTVLQNASHRCPVPGLARYQQVFHGSLEDSCLVCLLSVQAQRASWDTSGQQRAQQIDQESKREYFKCIEGDPCFHSLERQFAPGRRSCSLLGENGKTDGMKATEKKNASCNRRKARIANGKEIARSLHAVVVQGISHAPRGADRSHFVPCVYGRTTNPMSRV